MKDIIEIEKELAEYEGKDRVISFAEKKKEFSEQPKGFSIHCGFFKLDDLIDGFVEGELVLVSGRPKSGKTLWLQTLTSHFAGVGEKVLWFSYEVPARQFLDSFPELPEGYMPRQVEMANIWWLEERILESKLKYGTRIVMVDHLHYLVDMSRLRNASLEIGNVYRRLKLLAIKHKVIIFLISHLRKVEAGVEPQGEDIRDCLPGDQLIYSNGNRIKVNELKIGDKVVSFGGLDKSLQNDTVINIWPAGVKKIYRIKTKTNREIHCSAGHKFYATTFGIKNGSGLAGWTEMRNLSIGQKIAVIKKYPDIISIKESLAGDQSCVLGWLIGDGHINSGYFVEITAGSEEDAQIIKKLADNAFHLDCRITKYKEKEAYRIYLSAGRKKKGSKKYENELAKLLRKLKFNPIGDKKYIPDIIFKQSEKIVSAFLRGLFQADGSSSNAGDRDSKGKRGSICISLATISLRLAKDVQHLLLRLGIISYIGEVRGLKTGFKTNRSISWQVLIRSYNARNFYSRIGFLGEKQQHLKSVLKNWRRQNLRERNIDLFFDRIKSIEFIGEKETYDISVRGHHRSLKNNSFCVNDFITHNSNFALGEPDTILMLWRLIDDPKTGVFNEARLKVEMTRRTGVLKQKIKIRKKDGLLEEIE